MADSYVVDSYRYLRLALVVVTITLAISIVIELVVAGCFQGSISAFYYTPVHSIFIGALFVIGVSLVALIGRDRVEDLFFNLAGFLAPVVALVPTKRPDDLCGPAERHLDVPNKFLVANNTVALFIGFVIALVVAAVLAQRSPDPANKLPSLSKASKVGLILSGVVLLIGIVWYVAWNDVFLRRAHPTAAVLMFVAIWFAVLVNADFDRLRPWLTRIYEWLDESIPATDRPRHHDFYRPWYRRIAIFMAVAGVVGGIAVRAGVSQAVFWLETALIVPFAVFWALQTGEGWATGTTTERPRSRGDSAVA